MLYIIGLGLNDECDLTVAGLETLRNVDKVYFESYTSRYNGDLCKLGELTGKEIISLGRSDLEENPQENVLAAGEVALLVAGDPFVATTHSDLVLRAWKRGVRVKVIHNASVYSAVGETGLQLYKFGRTTTIAYPEGDYFPKSPYDAIKENHMRGLHTLCLLDVKADENRYMTVNEGINLLLRMESELIQNLFKEDTPCVGVARLGGDAVIKYGPAKKLLEVDFGGPPHVLIIPGKLHHIEKEILDNFKA
jgi:diphthine synthase